MKRLKLSLPLQILIALVLAVFCGLFFGDLTSPLAPIGNAFIMLLTMSVLPYVTFSLIQGIGSLSFDQGKLLLKKGFLLLVLIWVMVFITIYLLMLLFPSNPSPSFYSPNSTPQTTVNFIEIFIPSNPFNALANNVVPAVVLFSVLVGIALMYVPRKEALLAPLETAVSALVKITNWIVYLSPIGIFALIASSVGMMTMAQFEKIETYLLAFVVGSIFLTFFALPLLVTALTGLKYRALMARLQPALLISFSTGNIFITIPYIMRAINEIAEGQDSSTKITQSVVPIAYNLPLAGNLMTMFFILFLSYFYAQPFTFLENIRLIFVSLFALAGPVVAGLNSVEFLLNVLNLPKQGLSLYVETQSVTRNLTGLAGAMGIAVFGVLVQFAVHFKLKVTIGKIFKNFIYCAASLAILLYVAHFLTFKTSAYSSPFPDFYIESSVPAVVYKQGEALPPADPLLPGEDRLHKVLRSGVLRVGYDASRLPFCYFNAKQELVGYDIAFAYKLAASLNCKLQFVPFDLASVVQEIEEKQLDIVMSGLGVSTHRLQEISFAEPYMTVDLAFLVPIHQRDEFTQYAKIQGMQHLKIGVLANSHAEVIAKKDFPKATIVPLASYDEGLKPGIADVLIWTFPEAETWSLLHPMFSVVIPEPAFHRDYYAWGVPANSLEFIAYLNYWMNLEKLRGVAGSEYNKWILGRDEISTPRWSILDNVLHVAN